MQILSKGDKVKVKYLPAGSEGTIVAISSDGKLFIVEFTDDKGGSFTYSYEYSDLILVNTFLTKCECGAVYTSFPNSHAFWCPRQSIDNG